MLIAGAMSYSDQLDAATVAREVARQSGNAFDGSMVERFSSPRVAVFTIEDPNRNPWVDTYESGHTKGFRYGDFSYSVRNRLDRKSRDADWKPRGRWLSVEFDESDTSLTFTTDILGSLWVYYALLPEGLVFASDLSSLMRSLPHKPTIDPEAAATEFALTYSPGTATVFNGIKVLSPASRIRFNAAGMSVTDYAPIRFGHASSRLSKNEKFERLDHLFGSIADEYVSAFSPELVLSLSAGYDSRYALSILRSRGIEPAYCTFGNSQSNEVRNAEKVAIALGSTTHVFDDTQGDWAVWNGAISYLGMSGMIQWNGWSDRWIGFKKNYGSASVIGYLGDAISGKHLGKNASADQDWFQSWVNRSVEGGQLESPVIKAEIRQRLRQTVEARLQPHMLARDKVSFPHQISLHLDIFGRQNRRVAAQANLIWRHLTPVLFFYDKELIEFWCGLSFEDLYQQKLYQEYAMSRFKEIFQVFDQRRKPTSAERLASRFNELGRILSLQGRTPPPPTVIDHSGLLQPNKTNIYNLIEEVEPLVNPVLDLDQIRKYLDSPSTSAATSYQVIQAVNLCILAESSL